MNGFGIRCMDKSPRKPSSLDKFNTMKRIEKKLDNMSTRIENIENMILYSPAGSVYQECKKEYEKEQARLVSNVDESQIEK